MVDSPTGQADDNADPRATVRGELRYYGLVDWWFSAFTNEERAHIVVTFRPMGSGSSNESPLTHGEVLGSGGTAAGLLWALAGWFRKEGDQSIALRILAKAEELGTRHGDHVIDRHFTYHGMIEAYSRQNDPTAADAMIDACEKQIALASQVAAAMREEYPAGLLPSHSGFDHLFRIRMQQQRYLDAARLCAEARTEG
jgi:hypothetical protein